MLAGKTVLVTDASCGLGRTSALELGRLGAQVLVHCSRGSQRADTVVGDISKAGGKARKIAIDLRLADGPHRLAERTQAIIGGRLDILIVNATLSYATTLEDTTLDRFDELFAVNVRAPFFLIQHLLPIMCAGSQVVVLNQPAPQAVTGMNTAGAITASALDALARCFAEMLGPRGIRVSTSMHPGHTLASTLQDLI